MASRCACLNRGPTPHLEDVERIGPEDHGHQQEPHRPRLVARGTIQDVSGEKGRGREGRGREGEEREREGEERGRGEKRGGEGRGGKGERRERREGGKRERRERREGGKREGEGEW